MRARDVAKLEREIERLAVVVEGALEDVRLVYSKFDHIESLALMKLAGAVADWQRYRNLVQQERCARCRRCSRKV